MLTGLDHAELLAENLAPGPWRPRAEVCQEMTHLALSGGELSHLTTTIYDILRKLSGQEMCADYLGAIPTLAATGTPAGARLLAAFLNVASPGDRLLPIVRRLDSSRRYAQTLTAPHAVLGPFQGDWLKRLERLQVQARLWATDQDLAWERADDGHPRHRAPWPLLAGVLADLLERSRGETFAGPEEGVELMTLLIRLEVDARQERTSLLAGSVHPFEVATVARVLPLLNRADSGIRDLRQMVAALQAGDLEAAFLRPQARWRETLDDKDWAHLRRDLQARPELAGLARLAVGLGENPVPVPHLAAGTRRIVDLSAALVDEGSRDEPLDLFTATLLAQTHYRNGQIVFAVQPELAESLAGVLPDAGATDHPLAGIDLLAGLLVVDLPAGAPDQPHGLPALREMNEEEEIALKLWRQTHEKLDPADLEAMRKEALSLARMAEGDEDEDDEVEDMDLAALKHLVMTNIQSVSVLLGFLRNPKITSIPGLVEDVVNRTRNPQIIETICTDRTLHTGFANKGVPLACLRSPVNVSVKVLRKFCHVKYVSKVDLKRLAADRTGVRKEVGREIAKYLEALA